MALFCSSIITLFILHGNHNLSGLLCKRSLKPVHSNHLENNINTNRNRKKILTTIYESTDIKCYIFEGTYNYFILILCNFSLKPSISLRTPDKADKITTLIVVKRYGFALRPDILNGVSSSFNKSDASFRTLFETISSSFFLGFFSI